MPSFPESGSTSRKISILELLRPIRQQIRAASAVRVYGLVLLAALCSIAVFWTSVRVGHHPTEPLSSVTAPLAPIWPLPAALEISGSGNRRVFPYSIIPGGVESSLELEKAVLTDPVVARHYSDFDVAKVRRITLSSPQLMYVSYRMGNSIFWTKRKLMLTKGETMLTDGRSMARTRCGNRVSVLPVRPNALAEPTVEEFNAPVFPPSTSTPYLVAYSAPPALTSVPGPQSQAGPGSSFTPVIPFFPLPGGGGTGGGHSSTPPPGGGGGGGKHPPPGGGGGSPPPPVVVPPGPPVGVPEPGTAVLVLFGLAGVWLVRRNGKAC